MKQFKIHYFQHVPFEGLGYIEEWVSENAHTLSSTKFYQDHILPKLADIDWLIVMGGPMGVYDEEKYTWLAEEKSFIRKAIESGKTVIGICLGAQLVASVLGARVFPNRFKEIGWFPVHLTEEGRRHNLLAGFEPVFDVFHWHGDTFDLPENAIHLAKSDGCEQQAFMYNERVVGLQFHFEFMSKTFDDTIAFIKPELIPSKFIQSAEMIMNKKQNAKKTNEMLKVLLDKLANP